MLKMIKPEYLTSFVENYNYKVNGFMGQLLFPAEKTNNIKIATKTLVSNGTLPVMAQVHALDTEARIGDRTNYKELEVEKLLIKEKLNQSESLSFYLNSLGGKESDIDRYIFNDAASLVSRCITRTEVATMELVATGGITITENNVNLAVDFGYDKSKQDIVLSGWSNSAHDILKDISTIKAKAKNLGFTAIRAITSSKVVGYMTANAGIKAYWANKSEPLTENRMLTWVNEHFGIEFVINDETYKTSALSATQKRFYDEDKITFFGTRGIVGKGFFGVTPEELKLTTVKNFNKLLCTVAQWETPDPVAVWTKASCMYIPVPANINNMIIATVK